MKANMLYQPMNFNITLYLTHRLVAVLFVTGHDEGWPLFHF